MFYCAVKKYALNSRYLQFYVEKHDLIVVRGDDKKNRVLHMLNVLDKF